MSCESRPVGDYPSQLMCWSVIYVKLNPLGALVLVFLL